MNTRLFTQLPTPLPVGFSPYEGENTRNYCGGIFKLFSDVCSALLPLREGSKGMPLAEVPTGEGVMLWVVIRIFILKNYLHYSTIRPSRKKRQLP